MTARQVALAEQATADDERLQAVLAGDRSGFEVCMVPRIGRGIRTTRAFQRKDVLLRYFGELVSEAEAIRRENAGPQIGHFYRYSFTLHEVRYVLDATVDDGTYGRLVNHSRRKPNVHGHALEVDGVPAVVLIASRDLPIGTELRYDYGERRKAVLDANPWLRE